ncbi:MAG: cohesin domain-containing protein [Candidatus Doudnabacteria bacterium]
MKTYQVKILIFIFVATASLVFLPIKKTLAASFSISPNSGSMEVGSTFEASVLVDTQGQSINAVQVKLLFPADRLQLVSPSAGSSIIGIYTSPPKFDNQAGYVEIIGGIPNGVITSNGLVAKLTFRVAGVGSANLRFSGDSQILLNDGRGTNVLQNTFGANLQLELPAQQGPIVLSNTHPDQGQWYRDNNVNLAWDVGLPLADGYSYTVSDNLTDSPDDVIDSKDNAISYSKLQDGINYFHIKALRDGKWGGISRYSIKIDTTPPAEFSVKISPHSRTSQTNPFFEFLTTDSLSGLDRYQIKILPIKIEGRPSAQTDNQLFIDVTSPYAAQDLLYGTYEVIVRAYDNAGNIREVNQRLEITGSVLWFLGQDGIELPFGKFLGWSVVLPILVVLILVLLITSYFVRRWYLHYRKQAFTSHYPENLRRQLDELQKYRSKYGKMAVVLLFATIFNLVIFGSVSTAKALELDPPVITSLSQNIKTDELFYVSGRSPEPNVQVVVHVQSLVDGTAFDYNVTSDNRGDWIYRHDSFLQGGQYVVWAHTKNAETLSAPSAQEQIDVKPIAISWANSRVTYQSLYILAILALLLLLVVALIIYILVHTILTAKHRRVFVSQLRQAEDSIKRGFLVLRRDIEAELNLIKQASLSAEASGEHKVRQEQLIGDLQNIESLVGKELWEVETFENINHQQQ